jgi:hypothetical protein
MCQNISASMFWRTIIPRVFGLNPQDQGFSALHIFIYRNSPVNCEHIIVQWMMQGQHLLQNICLMYSLQIFIYLCLRYLFICFFCLIHLVLNWCDRPHKKYYREQHTSLLLRRLVNKRVLHNVFLECCITPGKGQNAVWTSEWKCW